MPLPEWPQERLLLAKAAAGDDEPEEQVGGWHRCCSLVAAMVQARCTALLSSACLLATAIAQFMTLLLMDLISANNQREPTVFFMPQVDSPGRQPRQQAGALAADGGAPEPLPRQVRWELGMCKAESG